MVGCSECFPLNTGPIRGSGYVDGIYPQACPDVQRLVCLVQKRPRYPRVPALTVPAPMRELHWYRCWAEEPGYVTGNPSEDYGQTRGDCSFPWIIAVDECFCTMHTTKQQTEQIPNDPSQMGAKSTTTSNHPSTPIEWSISRPEYKSRYIQAPMWVRPCPITWPDKPSNHSRLSWSRFALPC